MIGLNYNKGDFRTRLSNAINKALGSSMRLYRNTTQLTADTYRVIGSEGDEYTVRILASDGEPFVHCTCEAGINYQPCYHAAHVAMKRGLIDRTGKVLAVQNFGIGGELLRTLAELAQAATPTFELSIPVPMTVVFKTDEPGVLRFFPNN